MRNSLKGLIGFAAWAIGMGSVEAGQVNFIYLSPSDRPYRTDYEVAVEQAVKNLNNWLRVELGGYSLNLASDVVRWFQMPETAEWYQSNPVLRPEAARFWESVTDAGFQLTGGHFYDPDDIWIYYADVDPLPGQYYGGTSSVALLPANDLRGLAGEGIVPINPGDSSVNLGFDRWVGGLGHELGHAIGLPHPPDSPGGPDDWSLMYYGYLTFPDTYLRAEDREHLIASEFLAPVPLPGGMLLLGGLMLVGSSFRVAKHAVAQINSLTSSQVLKP